MSDNKKRVAWITGGGSGIGLAGAKALAAEGWTVVISGRRKDVIDGVAADIDRPVGSLTMIVKSAHIYDSDAVVMDSALESFAEVGTTND